MELKFEATESFEKSFEKLPTKAQKAITKKLSTICDLSGDYRILLMREGNTFYVMTVTDRKDTYR